MMGANMTDEGLDFLCAWEGCRLQVYEDAAGYPTIGVGHLICDGEDYSAGITHDEAMDLLREDVQDAQRAVGDHVKRDLRDHERDALISFAFNVGGGAFRRSTLLRRVNAGVFEDVPYQLSRWNKAGGRVLNGLSRRRAAEAEVFSQGLYSGPG